MNVYSCLISRVLCENGIKYHASEVDLINHAKEHAIKWAKDNGISVSKVSLAGSFGKRRYPADIDIVIDSPNGSQALGKSYPWAVGRGYPIDIFIRDTKTGETFSSDNQTMQKADVRLKTRPIPVL